LAIFLLLWEWIKNATEQQKLYIEYFTGV
jgi:hypothetical protein